MKRFSVFLLLFFVCLCSLSSESLFVVGETEHLRSSSVHTLRKKLNVPIYGELPFEERYELYQEQKLAIKGPVFKNLFQGFGKGSEMQGHTAGIAFGVVSDWATLYVAGAGLGLFLVDQAFVRIFSSDGYTPSLNNPNDKFNQISLFTMAVGGSAFLLGRVIQAIIPLGHGLRYNKTLRGGLGLTKDLGDALTFEVSLLPSSSTNVVNGISFGLTANLPH